MLRTRTETRAGRAAASQGSRRESASTDIRELGAGLLTDRGWARSFVITGCQRGAHDTHPRHRPDMACRRRPRLSTTLSPSPLEDQIAPGPGAQAVIDPDRDALLRAGAVQGRAWIWLRKGLSTIGCSRLVQWPPGRWRSSPSPEPANDGRTSLPAHPCPAGRRASHLCNFEGTPALGKEEMRAEEEAAFSRTRVDRWRNRDRARGCSAPEQAPRPAAVQA